MRKPEPKRLKLLEVLYGLPIGVNRIEDISNLQSKLAAHGEELRLLVDHPAQVDALEKFEGSRASPRRWSVFLKLDCGHK